MNKRRDYVDCYTTRYTPADRQSRSYYGEVPTNCLEIWSTLSRLTTWKVKGHWQGHQTHASSIESYDWPCRWVINVYFLAQTQQFVLRLLSIDGAVNFSSRPVAKYVPLKSRITIDRQAKSQTILSMSLPYSFSPPLRRPLSNVDIAYFTMWLSFFRGGGAIFVIWGLI